MTYLLLALISLISPLYGANANANASASAAPASHRSDKEEKRVSAHAAEAPARPEPVRAEEDHYKAAMAELTSRRPEPDEVLIQCQQIANPNEQITVLNKFFAVFVPNDLQAGENGLLAEIFKKLHPRVAGKPFDHLSSAWKTHIARHLQAPPAAQPAPSASASASAAQGGAGASAPDVKMAAAQAVSAARAAAASASASASAAAGQQKAPVSPEVVARIEKMVAELNAAKDLTQKKKIFEQICMEIPFQLLVDRADLRNAMAIEGRPAYYYLNLENDALLKKMDLANKSDIVNYMIYDCRRNWVALSSHDRVAYISRADVEDPYASGKLAIEIRKQWLDPLTHKHIVNISPQNLTVFRNIIRDLACSVRMIESAVTSVDHILDLQFFNTQRVLATRGPLDMIHPYFIKKILLSSPNEAPTAELFKISESEQLDIPLLRWTLADSAARSLREHRSPDEHFKESELKFISSLSLIHQHNISNRYFCRYGEDIDSKLGIKSICRLTFAIGQISRDSYTALMTAFPNLIPKTMFSAFPPNPAIPPINDRLPVVGTPLEYAIAKKFPVIVIRVLIKSGADVNTNQGGKTPLVVATLANNVDAVKELLKYGADINLGALLAVAQRPHVSNETYELLQKAGLPLPARAALGGGGGAAAAAAAIPVANGNHADNDGDAVMLPLASEARK